MVAFSIRLMRRKFNNFNRKMDARMNFGRLHDKIVV